MSAVAFTHDGFDFMLKAEPVLELQLPDDASDDERCAWDFASDIGIDPGDVWPLRGVMRPVRFRFSLRAETTRPLSDVIDAAWPGEVQLTWRNGGQPETTLVCWAASEVPADVSLLEAVEPLFDRQGPIGREAVDALRSALDERGFAPSVPTEASQIAQDGFSATLTLLGVGTMLAMLLSAQSAARAGGWERLGIVALTLCGLAVSLWLVDRIRRLDRDDGLWTSRE